MTKDLLLGCISKFWVAFLALVSLQLYAEKVLIITSAYSRPDFIEIQHRTFEKFLQDDYELVVFNDARVPSLQEAIRSTCKRLAVRCIDIPQKIHDQPYLERSPGELWHHAAVRNANVVQYALHNLGFAHQGIVAILDSDMFLVRPFSIKEFLRDNAIAGVPHRRANDEVEISYLWIGIAFLNMEKLPEKESINFNCGKVNGLSVDSGGYTYYYLKRHPEVKVAHLSGVHFPHMYCAACNRIQENSLCIHNQEVCRFFGLDDEQIDCLRAGLEDAQFFMNGTFFHYRAGSNWDFQSEEYHAQKTLIVDDYIAAILKKAA